MTPYLVGMRSSHLQAPEKHQAAYGYLLSGRHLQPHDLRYRDGQDEGVEQDVDDGEHDEEEADV